MQPDAHRTAFEKRKRSLFEASLEIPEEKRAAYVANQTRDDPGLGEAVLRLLASSRVESDGVLNRAVYERKTPSSERCPTAIGRYAVVKHLGTGGMGSVYLCKDPANAAPVAVKIVRSDFRSRSAREHFERERSILSRLQHPNVSKILDASVAADGTPFIVMQFVEGERIDSFCRQTACPLERRLLLFSQVLAGVEYFHNREVIHRDLKPSNILVTRTGSVQILDFGLARLIDHQKGQTGHGPTRTALPFMTLSYASPEQLAHRLSGRSSDIYSLGVVLYELLTGSHPYPPEFRQSPTMLLDFISSQSLAKPTHVSRGLSESIDHLILNALQFYPECRYKSAGLFLEDVRKYLEGYAVPCRYRQSAARANA